LTVGESHPHPIGRHPGSVLVTLSWGGVTEGEFTINVASRGPFAEFDWCAKLPGTSAKLQHVLQCTWSGRKIPIPVKAPEGWTADNRLKWECRFDKIATPTVFYKDNWVKRRLELKELKGVLDIPAMEECGTALRERMKTMRIPGKVYGALLAEISRGFKSNKRKREPEKTGPKVGIEELTTVTQRPSALAGAWSAGGNGKNSTAEPMPASRGPTNTAKATKADNAAIPIYLWNEAI
jgi:hypothetical protein